MPETTRTFVAIEIPAANRAAIQEFQVRLAEDVGGLRWTANESMHLTLAFLGDVPDENMPILNQEIAAALAELSPFSMTARGLGTFPNPSRAQTLWVALSPTPHLLPLQSAVAEAARRVGCPAKDERFTPHVTIARAGRHARRGVDLREPIRQYADWSGGSWKVSEVVVFSSDLTSKGPIYSPLGWAKLGGENLGGCN